MGKNTQRVQDMLDGNYKGKIQVGYDKVEQKRKIGDWWTDSDGKEWEQKNGYIASIKKTPNAGIGDQCSDCKKGIQKKGVHRDTYNRMGRCYHCQLNFEVDLKAEGKWEDWVKEMETKRWEAVLAEYESEMKLDENSKGAFDKTVANALANHEHRKWVT